LPWGRCKGDGPQSFVFGRKILLGLQASKCYGMRRGWGGERRRKVNTEKPNTRGKITFLTSLLFKKDQQKYQTLPSPAEEVFKSLYFFSSTLLFCCILHSPTPLRKLHRAETTCYDQPSEQRSCL